MYLVVFRQIGGPANSLACADSEALFVIARCFEQPGSGVEQFIVYDNGAIVLPHNFSWAKFKKWVVKFDYGND